MFGQVRQQKSKKEIELAFAFKPNKNSIFDLLGISVEPRDTICMIKQLSTLKLLARISGFQPISKDTDNNAAMYSCWWTNKRS